MGGGMVCDRLQGGPAGHVEIVARSGVDLRDQKTVGEGRSRAIGEPLAVPVDQNLKGVEPVAHPAGAPGRDVIA